MSVLGGLLNRKTNRVQTQRRKFFVPAGLVCFALTSISLALTVVEPFVNVGLVAARGHLEVTENAYRLTGDILLCALLIVFALITFLPVRFEEHRARRRLAFLRRLRDAAWWRRREILQIGENAIPRDDRREFRIRLKSVLGADADLAREIARMPWVLLLSPDAPYAGKGSYYGAKLAGKATGREAFNRVVGASLDARIRAASDCVDSFAPRDAQ